MKDSTELTALVVRAQAGDLDAFDMLVRRFQDMAVGYAYSILSGDPGAAQDAAQEAFIQLYADLPSLRAPEAFVTWFRRIIFKHCDRLIRGKRVETVALDIRMPAAAGDSHPAQVVEEREASAGLHRALQALPPDERTALVLFHFQDASLSDISSFLGISRSTVDHRLRLARKHLSEGIIAMLQSNLQANRPSNDTRFLMRVMDGLTGLSNLVGLDTRLSEEIEISRASRQGFGVVLFDIDFLGGFNQAHVHAAGDCLLAALANQVRPLLQPADFVARYAGDEFALVARRSAAGEVGQIGERIRQTIAGTTYRLGDVLLPDARHSEADHPLPPSPANEAYRQGLRQLGAGELAQASAAFQRALEQDADHVPSIMELEYLKLRQTLEPASLAEPFRITVSGGAAWYRAGDTAKTLLDRADTLLGQAKQNGRDQIKQEAVAGA
jgi:RNA polymerase sigma-70 factor (ECF subfamily)